MKVLLISFVYYPEPTGYRAHDMAVHLLDRGHEVTVITGLPSYPLGRLPPGYRVKPWQRETIDGVRVLRAPYIMDRSQSALRRVISYSWFAATAFLLGALLTKRPDVIWTNQIGLPGLLLSWLKRAGFVHEVQDLWPEWAQAADMGLGPRFSRALEWQERLLYRSAAAVTTISSGFKQRLVEKGVPADKIEVIPNWAGQDSSYPAPRDDALAAKDGLTRRFNVIYGGNIGTAQALSVVIEAAVLLHDVPEVQFVLIGDGVEREQLAQQAMEQGLDSVRFLGSRPRELMSAYFAWADVLLIHLKRDPVYEITIPSKTYAYLASGRPILVAADGNVTDLIREIDAGPMVPPEDPAALADAVRQLHAMPTVERETYGRQGRQAFVQRFSAQVLVDRYEALFNDVGQDSKTLADGAS